jgi:hypothetical protein
MNDSPYEMALSKQGNEHIKQSVADINASIELSKKLLLNNRVQNFTAADVVKTAEMIISRADQLEAGIVSGSQTVSPDDQST